MMQTSISSVRSAVRDIIRQHPRVRAAVKTRSIPNSFEQAIREGWAIADEQTTLAVDSKHRHGVATLRLAFAYDSEMPQ